MSGPNLSPAEMLRDRALNAATTAALKMPQVLFDATMPDQCDTADEADRMNAFSRRMESAQVDRTLRIARRFESYLRGGSVISDEELAELTGGGRHDGL